MAQDYKRNVYVIGAGFSKPAGGPLMPEFFDAMQGCSYAAEASDEDKGCLKFALDFRREMAKISDIFSFDLDNLESLFGLLEVKISAGACTDEDRRKFVIAILRTLELTINVPGGPSGLAGVHCNWDDFGKAKQRILQVYSEQKAGLLWLYYAFANMIGRTHYLGSNLLKDAVISFNYDLILDRAFADLGYPVNYHLASTDFTSDYHKTVSTIYEGSIPFLKLHGSANWFRCLCPNHLQRVYVASPKTPGNGRDVLRRSLAACPKCNPTGENPCGDQAKNHIPFIVPPTWNKAAYQDGLYTVWNEALKVMQSAGRIVMIGFSLPDTDLFFRFLLAGGVQVGRGVEVYVVDPSPAVAERYKRFLSANFTANRFHWGGDNQHFEKFNGSCLPHIARWISREV